MSGKKRSKKKSKRAATERAVRHKHTDALRDSMRAGRRRWGQGLGK